MWHATIVSLLMQHESRCVVTSRRCVCVCVCVVTDTGTMLRHRLRAVAVAAAIVLGMFMISDASASTQLATIVPMPSTLSAFTSASESKLTPLQAMAMQKAMFSVLNQTAQLTQRSCDDADCDASGLLSGTTNSATLKAAAFTPSDLNTTAFRTWTGNVDNLVEMFQLAAKAQVWCFVGHSGLVCTLQNVSSCAVS